MPTYYLHGAISEQDLAVYERLQEQIAAQERETRFQLHQAGKTKTWAPKATDRHADDRPRTVDRVPRKEIKHSCVERRREELGGRSEVD